MIDIEKIETSLNCFWKAQFQKDKGNNEWF